jgi:hypothetical protein
MLHAIGYPMSLQGKNYYFPPLIKCNSGSVVGVFTGVFTGGSTGTNSQLKKCGLSRNIKGVEKLVCSWPSISINYSLTTPPP